VFWKYGGGKVVWYGLRLPYHAMYYENVEESKMLVNMIKYVALLKTGIKASIELDNLQAGYVAIRMQGASRNTGIWVKISHYAGWEAFAEGKPLKIYRAGPDMMLVFPELDAKYTLVFRYGKNTLTRIGELVAIVGLIMLVVSFVAERWTIPRGWTKTSHKGFVGKNKQFNLQRHLYEEKK